MPLNEKLKIARLTKGWTQEELAEKLGYSTNGYAKLERGENGISLEKLEKLAEVLEVELTQLLDQESKTVFNITDCHYSNSSIQGNIILTEAKCAFELEKAQLLLKERERENELLRDEIGLLKEMLALLKVDKA